MDQPRSVNRIRAELAAARVTLKDKYTKRQDDLGYSLIDDFGLLDHSSLYCSDLRGEDTGCGQELDQVEELERELEAATGTLNPERWVARFAFAKMDIERGDVVGEDNVDRVARFMDLAEKKVQAANQDKTKATARTQCEAASLLHSTIAKASWAQYRDGHIRDAVLNALLAIGDMLRARTGLKVDGKALAELAFSPNEPYLIVSELMTESGRNDQLGFMQMVSGAFTGIRNVKAHSLKHDLDDTKALQYLVFASLLARRIEKAVVTSKVDE